MMKLMTCHLPSDRVQKIINILCGYFRWEYRKIPQAKLKPSTWAVVSFEKNM